MLSKNFTEENIPGWRFDNSYARLPPTLFSQVCPVAVKKPTLVLFNDALAKELDLNHDLLKNCPEIFTGNKLPSNALPIAMAYAGHQYGYFTMLGDGRAVLLGEHLNKKNQRFDIQLKGSGPTQFSRQGDGRATLAAMLREYIISEAMHALAIPTTRSLAVATTGEQVLRQQQLPGAILTRIASSHIRVGTFQYAARNFYTLKVLADYTINRHYPKALATSNPYLSLLYAVINRQARLIARWLHVGFVHGVMNTDNMSIAGETIDYGPCAFIDEYDPSKTFSSIDEHGRYAFGRQPYIASWNLARFAETLLPLLDNQKSQAVKLAEGALATFNTAIKQYWHKGMMAKLGIDNIEAGDGNLINNLINLLQKHKSDYINSMRAIATGIFPGTTIFNDPVFTDFYASLQARQARQSDGFKSRTLMLKSNPVIIPRNYFVESVINAAVNDDDYAPIQLLLKALARPFEEVEKYAVYKQPLLDKNYKTFCGT